MSGLKLIVGGLALMGALFFLSTLKPALETTADVAPSGTGGGVSIGALLGALTGPVNLMDQGQPEPTDPAQMRRAEFYGWKAQHPGMAAADDAIFSVHDAMVAAEGANLSRTPADYRILATDPTCTPRPLGTGEVLGNVHIGGAGDRVSGLHLMSSHTLAEDTAKWLAGALRRPDRIDEDKLVQDHALPVANVIVTDTSGPVYLLLQNRYGNGVLWNVHPAAGVTIAHIALIGPNVALSPPPGDYDIQHMLPDGTCMPRVGRQPRETWDMYHRPGGLTGDFEAKATATYLAYDGWFRRVFGQGSEDGVVGFDTSPHVLVGPLPAKPEERVTYRPLAGETVLVQSADYIFAGPAEPRIEFLKALQLDLVTEAAGGDLALVFPETMTREVTQ